MVGCGSPSYMGLASTPAPGQVPPLGPGPRGPPHAPLQSPRAMVGTVPPGFWQGSPAGFAHTRPLALSLPAAPSTWSTSTSFTTLPTWWPGRAARPCTRASGTRPWATCWTGGCPAAARPGDSGMTMPPGTWPDPTGPAPCSLGPFGPSPCQAPQTLKPHPCPLTTRRDSVLGNLCPLGLSPPCSVTSGTGL